MIKLNLVSGGLKKEIKLRRIYSNLKKLVFLFILIIIIYSLVLLFSRVIILNSFEEIVAQTTLIAKNAQNYNASVDAVNQKIEFVEDAQKNFLRLSCFLRDIREFAGPDVTINNIKFEMSQQSALIRGQGKSRDSLLNFKNRLEQSGYFTSVELPLKDLLTRENSNFEITARVEISRLK